LGRFGTRRARPPSAPGQGEWTSNHVTAARRRPVAACGMGKKLLHVKGKQRNAGTRPEPKIAEKLRAA